MRVLITGAGGRVGREVCKELAKDHALRLLNIRPIEVPEGEVLRGSVADWETVKRAVDGMDAIVHLAIHSPAEQRHQAYYEYIQADVDVGVKGTDMLLYVAKENGVKRFVYTSSLNVYSARYPGTGAFLQDSDETLSAEHYGTVKWLAEELCRHYALRQGLSAIVLRFNSVTFPEIWMDQGRDLEYPDYACTRVHIADVVHAVRLAIEKEDIQWGRCLISGANPEKRHDTNAAEELIGFRARYGFAPGRMYGDGVVIDGG